ncbi:Nucleoporin nup57 [Recurvomyces mirabilis]|nr:Nucleoporin nup57 [Recurvomyces mirabilis]
MTSLFGNTGGGSLFGNNNTTAQSNAPPAGQSLFNPAPTQQQQQQQPQQPQQNNGGSLFGNSLFGNTQQQQPQQQQQQQQQAAGTSSLFGNQNQHNTGAAPSSLFSNPSQPEQPQQPHQQQQPTQQFQPPNLTLPQQQDLARSRLTQAGLTVTRSDEKPIPDRAATLLRKWDPQSQSTLLQSYLYNAVPAVYAPFYNAPTTDDEAKWEEALQSAPKLDLEEGSESLKNIPVLVRGFWDLGKRVEYQAHTLTAMQTRLHEMHASLSAVMTAHQQRITAQIESTKRAHVALAQRTLALSVKLQVLRGRGFALDQAEEGLRKQLLLLEQGVRDPGFGGREEEVWARLCGLRERVRWLVEEGRRLEGGAGGVGGAGSGSGGGGEGDAGRVVPRHVLEKTGKILADYEAQLVHLGRELERVGKEFGEWEADKTSRVAGR